MYVPQACRFLFRGFRHYKNSFTFLRLSSKNKFCIFTRNINKIPLETLYVFLSKYKVKCCLFYLDSVPKQSIMVTLWVSYYIGGNLDSSNAPSITHFLKE